MKKRELLKKTNLKAENATAEIIVADDQPVLAMIYPNNQKGGSTGYIHYLWNDGYLTYYLEDRWTREKYETVIYNSYLEESMDDIGLEAVRTYLNIGYASAYQVEQEERRISLEKQMAAEDRKQERITKELNEITQPLPVGFYKECYKIRGQMEKIDVKLFQRAGEETVERIFRVEAGMITELCRAFQSGYGKPWRRWYYGIYNGGCGEKQSFWDRKNKFLLNTLPQKHYLYDNLDSLEMTKAQKSCLRLMSGLVDPSLLLYLLDKYPSLEYLIKYGMKRMAAELIESRYNAEVILEQVGGLSKQTRRRLVEVGGGVQTMNLLKEHPAISDANLKEFAKIKSYDKATKLRRVLNLGVNPNHVMQLLKKTGGITVEACEHYWDYLEMARERGQDIREEIVYRNKRWKEFHDRYVVEDQVNKDTKKKALKNDQYMAIRADYVRNKKLFAWSNEEYAIFPAKDAAAIITEGQLQHHCVGSSDRYMKAMAERESYICFLRRKEDIQKPYYTIEVSEKEIRQWYGEYDRKPDEKAVKKVLNEWMKQVKKNFRKLKKKALTGGKTVKGRIKAAV